MKQATDTKLRIAMAIPVYCRIHNIATTQRAVSSH